MSPSPRTVALPVRGLLALAAVLALAAAAMAFRATASAEVAATTTLSFRELDRGSHFVHIRNTPTKRVRSNQQGDLIAFTNPLVDAAGTRIGTLHADCTTTVGARNFLQSTLTCLGVLALHDGTLTVQLITSPGTPTSNGAVTGGTGAYANARGVFVTTDSDAGADDVVTLVG